MIQLLSRYLLVGTGITLLDLGVLGFLVEAADFHYLLAGVISFLVAVTASFFANKSFTFRSKSKAKKSQFFLFVTISTIAIILNTFFLWFWVELAHLHYLLAKILASGTVFLWNFFGYKNLVFFNAKPFAYQYETSKFEVSFLVPCYNELARLHFLEDFAVWVQKKCPFSAEIIVCDDGSTDDTKKSAEKINHITVLTNKTNQGKGAALKKAATAARGKYLVLIDLDNLANHQAIEQLYKKLQKHSFVITNRNLPTSQITTPQPWYRVRIGWFGNWLIQKLLSIKSSDTQCGLKGIEKKLAKKIFSKSVINRWGIDIEMLLIAQKNNISWQEIPICWAHDRTTKFHTLWSPIQTFLSLIRIWIGGKIGAYLVD